MTIAARRLPRVGRVRARLGTAATAGRIMIVAVALAGGFATVAQLGSTARAHANLAGDSPEDLTRILASLNTGADGLRDEISNLKLQLLGLQTSTQRDVAAQRAAQDQLRALQVLAGTVPVFGPGVEARIVDPNGAVTYDLLISTMEELRDAGAEAIAVNGNRLGASSWFGTDGAHVTLGGIAIQPPYVIDAIGDPATLDSGLRIPGGSVDALSALAGVNIDVHGQARLDLPALARAPAFSAARPVGSNP